MLGVSFKLYRLIPCHLIVICYAIGLLIDTIRKMKNDFKKMEDEMDCLSANMAAITEFSANISGTLQDQHAQITKLSGKESQVATCNCYSALTLFVSQ